MYKIHQKMKTFQTWTNKGKKKLHGYGLSELKFNFALTLGFLNSALNNLDQALKFLSQCWKKSSTPAIHWAGSSHVLLVWGHYLLV